ncbi:Serine hydroxymethyltransferase [Candidatus Westeberhardia cardiocondylae]|uniref:Serine hydroxymethyltransferase n=1 Tax=Candidatus Westeberhardia cardiocondylae TaxID=1594731 RepID=A0A0H5BX86_9ENTR|nr:serine hydroxymethyltransferase [Candidatus Westeberhardia cardiocondylae]CEN32259.1 Serine hydroxymethyltransferase [Candidatus Westeberhardia cardiocondylae]
MLSSNVHISDYDFELWKIIQKEKIRQEENIELIASENYVSSCVMQAQGSQLTNKYAEGYPGNRYYGGCVFVDEIEQLAIDRAKILFGVDYVNVQPHSGSQANFAVYSALLDPGDTILGMKLDHGGHLTHGSLFNFSGKFYNIVSYGMNCDGEIDYTQLYKLAKIHNPKIIVGGFSSYSGTVDWSRMRDISDCVNAYLLVDMSHIAGLVVAGIYPNPIPYAHVVTTTTHKTLVGPRGGMILASGGNKEMYNKLNSAVFPGTQGGPLVHVIAAKAVAFKEAMCSEFKKYQHQVVKNSKAMVEVFLLRGFTVVSGSTDSHLFLLNLSNKNLTGKKADEVLSKANIIVNKNRIPNDRRSSNITSGLRIGTPAVTRRGFVEEDVKILSHWICDILNDIQNKRVIIDIKNKVLEVCSRYPVYIK